MAKALLLKKWGANYAGQVLTNVQKGSIPADVARFYEDDEPTPMDVVKDPNPGTTPLTVVNDEMDPKEVDAADAAQAAKVKAAESAPSVSGVGDAAAAVEAEDTQRRAREADNFAAKANKSAAKGADKRTKTAKARAGKEHGVK